ncbi:YbaK/EbsC family protein [Cryptosporangium phraense]|uniref:YbaK/EbsC family protein n=1 Tax=Cryptosporangium phraense TaxID=2593070 RepID=A0A545AJP4_9ACTN|nr:YbaK/EbsC family protein [Cryptosporangium phraense]TQS41567.1 YbaK/EbsC family protein [Cryptosporangium phraense]
MTSTEHPNVAAVNDVLAAFGSQNRVQILPAEARTAAAAAEALGVTVGQIANSLVFDADGVPLLVLASGAHRVDTAMVASLCEVASVRRATPDFVRDATGQAIGGVAPVGHPVRLRTLVDVALARYETVWAAGGIPHAVFPTTYDELLRITGGVAAEVA